MKKKTIELKTGDLCPCCGQPIKSRNPAVLRVLSVVAQERWFLTGDVINELVMEVEADAGKGGSGPLPPEKPGKGENTRI